MNVFRIREVFNSLTNNSLSKLESQWLQYEQEKREKQEKSCHCDNCKCQWIQGNQDKEMHDPFSIPVPVHPIKVQHVIMNRNEVTGIHKGGVTIATRVNPNLTLDIAFAFCNTEDVFKKSEGYKKALERLNSNDSFYRMNKFTGHSMDQAIDFFNNSEWFIDNVRPHAWKRYRLVADEFGVRAVKGYK